MKKINILVCSIILSGVLGAFQAWGQESNETDSLLGQLDAISVSRGTETTKTAENFQKAVNRLSEKRNSEKVRLIKESKRSDKGWEYRCTIMRVMAPVQDDSVAAALIENLKDKSSKLRGCAAKQLGEQKQKAVGDVLLKSLSDNDAMVRANSAHSLG